MQSDLPDDVLSDEPIMPEVQIKPNKAIPITIGVCLILGSLLVGFFALSNLTTGTVSAEEADALADSLNIQGANLTGSDVTDYFDELQKMNDDPLLDCPVCNKPKLKRLLSAPSFRLKGSGWYETDFKKDNQRNVAKSDNENASKGSADKKKEKNKKDSAKNNNTKAEKKKNKVTK